MTLHLIVDRTQERHKLRDGRLVVDQDDDPPPMSIRTAIALLLAASVALWAAIWFVVAWVAL